MRIHEDIAGAFDLETARDMLEIAEQDGDKETAAFWRQMIAEMQPSKEDAEV